MVRQTQQAEQISKQVLHFSIITTNGERWVQRNRVSGPDNAHDCKKRGQFQTDAVYIVHGTHSAQQRYNSISRDISMVRQSIQAGTRSPLVSFSRCLPGMISCHADGLRKCVYEKAFLSELFVQLMMREVRSSKGQYVVSQKSNEGHHGSSLKEKHFARGAQEETMTMRPDFTGEHFSALHDHLILPRHNGFVRK